MLYWMQRHWLSMFLLEMHILQRRAFQLEQNRHLGLWDRESTEPVIAAKEDKQGAPGSAANIDESANIGQPQFRERRQRNIIGYML